MGSEGAPAFLLSADLPKLQLKNSKKSSAKATSVVQGLPKLSSVRGAAGEMSPGHGAPCLGEVGNAFFR